MFFILFLIKIWLSALWEFEIECGKLQFGFGGGGIEYSSPSAVTADVVVTTALFTPAHAAYRLGSEFSCYLRSAMEDKSGRRCTS